MSKSEPEIVEFPYDDKVWRFSPTYSIKQDGKFWMQKNGIRRRAFSTRESANNAILNWRIRNC